MTELLQGNDGPLDTMSPPDVKVPDRAKETWGPVFAALKAEIPSLRLEWPSDYGRTWSCVNPEKRTGAYLEYAYRPERDGRAGYYYVTMDLLDVLLERLRGE